MMMMMIDDRHEETKSADEEEDESFRIGNMWPTNPASLFPSSSRL